MQSHDISEISLARPINQLPKTYVIRVTMKNANVLNKGRLFASTILEKPHARDLPLALP